MRWALDTIRTVYPVRAAEARPARLRLALAS
jgi:hypothetical protein